MEQTLEYVWLVGLSATLPNYQDVATYLWVDELKGLFYFYVSYGLCGLQQQFIKPNSCICPLTRGDRQDHEVLEGYG